MQVTSFLLSSFLVDNNNAAPFGDYASEWQPTTRFILSFLPARLFRPPQPPPAGQRCEAMMRELVL